MGIGVFTYNIPHRKTYDVLCLLKARGYQDVSVYATPMHYKKKFRPLYEHRPSTPMYIMEPLEICKNFNYKYIEGQFEDFIIPTDEVLLVGGAGIIPERILSSHIIINSHPGFIPYSRGLDAFKWAIYEGTIVGVTTHILGEYIDAGEVIERKKIPIYSNDTFHSVAQRVYEYEIGMLVDAIEQVHEVHELILPGNTVVHKRMPKEFEIKLLDCFEIYKKRFIDDFQ